MPASRHSLSRRGAFTGFSAAAILGGLPAPVAAETAAVEDYRLVMARKDAANASSVWADVEDWCDEEAEALARLAASPGGLRDLLAKVIILAERSDERCWNLQDEEEDLIDAMRDQAEALLLTVGGRA